MIDKLIIQPLKDHHIVDNFFSATSCDLFLKKNREYLANYDKFHASTYVIVDEGSHVIAFYAISISKQKPNGLFLEELAVDRRFHGQGLGRLLLLDVFKKCLAISDFVECAGVHLISELDAIEFYKKFGFEAYSPFCELHLFIPREKLV